MRIILVNNYVNSLSRISDNLPIVTYIFITHLSIIQYKKDYDNCNKSDEFRTSKNVKQHIFWWSDQPNYNAQAWSLIETNDYTYWAIVNFVASDREQNVHCEARTPKNGCSLVLVYGVQEELTSVATNEDLN